MLLRRWTVKGEGSVEKMFLPLTSMLIIGRTLESHNATNRQEQEYEEMYLEMT